MIYIKKIEKEYLETYGDVPLNQDTRIMDLIEQRTSNREKSNLIQEFERIKAIKKETVSFVIYLCPKATPRPRENRKRKIFYVMGAKDNRDIFAKFLLNTRLDIITTACTFDCTTYMDIPNSMTKVEKILAEMGLVRPIGKPDWDNLGKTYSDMIQGSFLLDDSLIIDGRVRKFYSSKPRIEITMTYMTEHDSLFNLLKIRKRVAK